MKKWLVAFIVVLMLVPTVQAQSWWDNDCNFRTPYNFTANNGSVNNFPVLLNISDGTIDDGKTSDDGSDVKIIDHTGAAGVEIDHYIHTWNESGNRYLWVEHNINDSNNTGWIYYGCSANDSSSVNDTLQNIISYWKLEETGAPYVDAVDHSNLTNVDGSTQKVLGGINYAQDFEITDPDSLRSAYRSDSVYKPTTFTFLVKANYESASLRYIVHTASNNNASANNGWFLRALVGREVGFRSFDGGADGDRKCNLQTTNLLALGNDYTLGVVNDGTTRCAIFMNGNEEVNAVPSDPIAYDANVPFRLGHRRYTNARSFQWDGLLDEPMWFSDAKNTTWMANFHSNPTINFLAEEAGPIANTISINATAEDPVDPFEWEIPQQYNFSATTCDTTGVGAIVNGNLTFDGTLYDALNTSINASCLDFYVLNLTNLTPATYSWTWNVTNNLSSFVVSSSDYTVTKNTSQSLSLTISPSTNLNPSQEMTATCTSPISGTSLTLLSGNSVVSNPFTSILPVGETLIRCQGTHGNYSFVDATSTVSVIGGGISGCHNSTTFAFQIILNVTNNDTTALNFSSLRSAGMVRPDLEDIRLIPNQTPFTINNTSFLSINTSGLINQNLTVQFGNALNNNSTATVGGAATPTITNNFTNFSQISPYVNLTFLEEKNTTNQKPPDANLSLDFYCVNGVSSMTLVNGTDNNTNILVATNRERFTRSIATVIYAPNDFYKRHLLHETTAENNNLWLVDANVFQVLQIINTLQDLTGRFDNANFTVNKIIGGELEVIDEQPFDASNIAIFYAVAGELYQYVVSTATETRILGDVVADVADLDKTITLTRLSDTTPEYFGNLTLTTAFDNTTGFITTTYGDPFNATNEINITIRDENDTQLFFSQFIDGSNTTETVVFSFLVPNVSNRYFVTVEIDHEVELGEIVANWIVGGGELPQDMAVFTTIYVVLFFLLGFLAVVLSISPRFIPFGMFVALVFGMIINLRMETGINQYIFIFAIVANVFWIVGAEVRKR